MEQGWLVRRAMAEDLEGLLGVARGCVEAPGWSETIWREVLEEKLTRVCLVAEREGTVVGFVVVGVAAGVAQLESAAVAAVLRRQGMGRALCRAGMAWARDAGAASMELEVRAGSTGARALYVALGFQEQGRRRGYYRGPMEDAVLMGSVL